MKDESNIRIVMKECCDIYRNVRFLRVIKIVFVFGNQINFVDIKIKFGDSSIWKFATHFRKSLKHLAMNEILLQFLVFFLQ